MPTGSMDAEREPTPVDAIAVHRLEAAAALLAWSLFAALTYAVLDHGPITAIDASAIAWATTHHTELLTRAAYWASSIGGPSIISVYAGLLIVVLLVRRGFATALAVAFIVYGGVALNVAVKDSVQRGRPMVENPLVHLVTYSFPSGHAAAATVFGGLSMIVCARSAGSRTRSIAGAAIVGWITAVCGSRIYLGAHFPTDVAAGILEGTGWLLLCDIALRRWQIPLRWPHRSE